MEEEVHGRTGTDTLRKSRPYASRGVSRSLNDLARVLKEIGEIVQWGTPIRVVYERYAESDRRSRERRTAYSLPLSAPIRIITVLTCVVAILYAIVEVV